MGNSCFASTKNCIQSHFDICVDNNISNINVEESINEEKISNNKINKLKNYFSIVEKEISDDLDKRNIKISAKKKRNSGFINLLLIDKSKYENMLNKLLEQQNIERKGPKRRETIRTGNKINDLVKEVINEKKNNEKNKLKPKRRYSLIIKNKDKQKIRQSSTLHRNEFLKCKSLNKKLKSQLKNVNTLNEILTDGNRSTVFNKKETNKYSISQGNIING
jgi:hypothetical protein